MVDNESDTFAIGGEREVRRLGFGAMRITGPDIIGPPADEGAARALCRRAAELRDVIDTADSYGPGVSERLLGETVADRDDVLVATKAGLLRNRDGDWLLHGDPDSVRTQALVSRDRLGVDSIDRSQYHGPDPDTPFAATVEAFGELTDDGIVDHVGLSNVSVDQLETARDHVAVATVQNHYNVATRDTARVAGDGRRVLAACEEYGIGFIPYVPLAAGDLDGVDAVGAVAAARDATPHQVALAWLLARSDVTPPIPGTGSVAHLEENVAASGLELTEAEVARLSAAAG